MASDDVIELGSSDEDTEPAPKKKKPTPNAMVHIPSRLPGLSIQSTKICNNINTKCIVGRPVGESLTITKISNGNINPFAKKFNGRPVTMMPSGKRVHIPVQKNISLPILNRIGSAPINSTITQTPGINPLIRPGTKIYPNKSRVYNNNGPGVNPLNIVKILNPGMSIKGNFSGSSQKNITTLPPGITVKRTTQKKFKPMPVVRTAKPGTAPKEVLTVDLDDDEPTISSAAGPQWYLKPEEIENADKSPQKTQGDSLGSLEDKSPENKTEESHDQEKISDKTAIQSQKLSPDKLPDMTPTVPEPSDLEQQNNKEPSQTAFIEITIEDSPIKNAQSKKGFKVGTELPITIEDSPVRGTTDKTVPRVGSDDENAVRHKEPNSKKRLEYPKNAEMVETLEIEYQPVEIEFEPLSAEKPVSNNEENKEKPKRIVEVIDVVEIEESPVKPQEIVHISTPKKNRPTKQSFTMTPIESVDDQEKDEFHPTYQSFINLCFQLENSEDMKKIVEKKIKAYYRQVPKDYTESESFIDMVSSKIGSIKASPEKMYLYIKDVVDELNLQRKLAKAQPLLKIKREQEKFLYGEESEFDSKRQRQIRKLEKTLKKLHRAIQKLEEQEVDFDDEEDSVYILTESEDDTPSKDVKPLNKEALLQRYKERMVRVHAKLCQLTNTKMPSEARVQIDARPGQPKGPAKRLEKWINKKVPIGTPLPFPDFHNVLCCVREANQEDKLGWNEADIMDEARDLFTRCGKKLQRRRQENEWRLAASRIPVDIADPAENSPELKKKLDENKQVAAKKETEVFNKYADRQNQLKLEAVEIGDKEAEESPVESDDEETVNENASLTSKVKRKERLKRLLQEKSKKTCDEKENLAEKSSQNKDMVTKDSNEVKNSTNDSDIPVENEDNIGSPESRLLQKSISKNELTVELGSGCKNKDKNERGNNVQSLSDESNKVDSDIDELHLLQKLYSENECNTSVMDSDSDTPIAISDTSSVNEILSSDEKLNNGRSSDIISIENSSYSESEEKIDDSLKTTGDVLTKEVIQEAIDSNMEMECISDGVEKKKNKTNDQEYNKSLEDILLASSDEADDTEGRKKTSDNDTSMNLRDDSISIGETVIQDGRKLEKGLEVELKSDQSCKNLNTDASLEERMEICPTEIHSKEHTDLEENIGVTTSSTQSTNTTEITNVKSTEPCEKGHAVKRTSIKSVDDENTSEKTVVKPVESNEENNITETIDNDNVNDITNIKSNGAIDDENHSETTAFKPVESIEDETINNSIRNIEDSSTISVQKTPMDTTENTDAVNEHKVADVTKENIPQGMEVDSII